MSNVDEDSQAADPTIVAQVTAALVGDEGRYNGNTQKDAG